MDHEIPNATQDAGARFPWLASYPPGVPATIEQAPYELLGDIPPDLAARKPAAPAFTTIMPNGMAASLSYLEVERYSDDFAAFLREKLCLEPGARVAIQIPNGLPYPVAAFGIFKAGCVLVNVNPLYTAHEMVHLFQDAEPAAIVAIDMFADKLADALKVAPIPHVVLTEAASLFPMASRRLIGFVQKYVRNEVPVPRFHHTAFAKALAMGRASIRAGANVKAYTRGLGAVRRCLPAIYGRHHGREQGSHADAPQSDHECGAVPEPQGRRHAGKRPSPDRAPALPYLRLHREPSRLFHSGRA